jgi:hypothetical protein
VQRRTLALPLVFLFLLQIGSVALTLFCDMDNAWATETCGMSTYASSLMDPTGRLNRMIRFTLFVAFLQWTQQFFLLFPTWYPHVTPIVTPVVIPILTPL